MIVLHPLLVKKIDEKYPSIEIRGSKIYNILKKYFDSHEIEDYDLDSFSVYWLASRADSQMLFCREEIVALTRIINFRHYNQLWEQEKAIQSSSVEKTTKETNGQSGQS